MPFVLKTTRTEHRTNARFVTQYSLISPKVAVLIMFTYVDIERFSVS